MATTSSSLAQYPSLAAQARDVSALRFQLVQEAQLRSQLESALLSQRAEAASASAAAAHALELQRATCLGLQEQLDELRSRIAASPSTQPPASAICLPAGPVATASSAPAVANLSPPDPVQFNLVSTLEAKASHLQEVNASLSRAVGAKDNELRHLREHIQKSEEEKKSLAARLDGAIVRSQAEIQANGKSENQFVLLRKLALAEAEIETLRIKVDSLSEGLEKPQAGVGQVLPPRDQPGYSKPAYNDVGIGDDTICIEDEMYKECEVEATSLLKDEISSLKLTKRTLEDDHLTALRALREALKSKEELAERVRQLENQEMDSPTKSDSEKERTIAEGDYINQRISELESNVERLSSEKLKADQEKKSLLELIDDLKAQARVSQAGIEEYKQLYEDTRREKIDVSESMKRALATTEKNFLDEKRKEAKRCEDLEQKIASMKSKLDTITRERDQRSELVQDLDSAKDQMTDVIRKLSDEKKELGRQLESALTSSAIAATETERMAKENKRLKAEVRSIDEEKDKIVADIDAMSEKLAEIEEERDVLASERVKVIDELTRLKDDMRKKEENFGLAEAREEKLEEKLSATEAEVERLQDSLLSREAQLEAAVEDLAAATREQQVVNEEMTMASEELRKKTSDLAEAENKLQVLQSSIESLKRDNAQLESSYKGIEHDLKRAFSDIGAGDAQGKDLAQQIVSLRRQIDIHEKNNLELDYECQRLQDRLAEIDGVASSYRNTMDDLVRELEIREQELSRTLDARKELEHELLSARDAISVKESKYQELQHKLAAATFENQRKGQSAITKSDDCY